MVCRRSLFVFFFFLERELFLKAKVNAVIERTLIHSHVKWPCEESPQGEKALNEFEREREREKWGEWEGGRQIERKFKHY